MRRPNFFLDTPGHLMQRQTYAAVQRVKTRHSNSTPPEGGTALMKKFAMEALCVAALSMLAFRIIIPMILSNATWQEVLRESVRSSGLVVSVFVIAAILQTTFVRLRYVPGKGNEANINSHLEKNSCTDWSLIVTGSAFV